MRRFSPKEVKRWRHSKWQKQEPRLSFCSVPHQVQKPGEGCDQLGAPAQDKSGLDSASGAHTCFLTQCSLLRALGLGIICQHPQGQGKGTVNDAFSPWLELWAKIWIVKAMVFPTVIHRCENWTKKKAEHQRTDAFKLRCWKRLLTVPWTARRSNQSILKEISPEYSLEGLMLKLKLQYFGHLMWRANSLEKALMLAKTEGKRRSG